MGETPRLDILIYGHDGRGLGHVSRSVGIGMALRRLYPQLKVLLVSGSRFTGELTGESPLDWLKLPSYETTVVAGKSKGIIGKSMYADGELGILRAKELAHLITLYRPRLVLVDHTPQGKHKELLPALLASGNGTKWVLGVRGVVGSVAQARSGLANQIFADHYHALFWYGDSSVLGMSHLQQLEDQYDTDVLECGYVVRLAELCFWNKGVRNSDEKLAGTISIPWLGEKSMTFLACLAKALKNIPISLGRWHLFAGSGGSDKVRAGIDNLFGGLDNCHIESPGLRYVSSLLRSKTALVYGGYNSLMDIIYCGMPSLVVLREMEDKEQQIHLDCLLQIPGNRLTTVQESQVSPEELESLLMKNLQAAQSAPPEIQTDGAVRAAYYLNQFLHGEE